MSRPGASDLIVVGAGAAGCEIARQASRTGQSVTLIEAGTGRGRHLFQRIPLLVGKILANPGYAAHSQSAPQPGLNGRRTPVVQGMGLGGSSRVNGNVAEPGDIRRWARVLPFWDHAVLETVLAGLDQSGGAPVPRVESWTDALSDRFLSAAGPRGDAAPLTVNTRGGWRYNHFDAFRANADFSRIRVITGTRADRLLVEAGRVTGVRTNDGETHDGGEVVLTAGAIGTPDLLFRSGLGPATALEDAGRSVVLDLPQAGAHLKDHANIRISFAAPGHDTLNQKTRGLKALWEGLKFLAGSDDSVLRGPGASAGVNVALGNDPFARAVRVQLVHFTQDRAAISGGIRFERKQAASIGFYPLWPRSEGWIKPQADGGVSVTPNFLGHDDDLAQSLAGLALAQEIVRDMGFTPDTMGEAEDMLRGGAYSGYHLIGSCRMAEDANCGVVGPDFAVHGLSGLSICDASVKPDHLSSHSYLPVIALARMLGQQRGWRV